MCSTLAAVAFLAFAGVFLPAHFYVLHKTALCHFAAMHLSRGATRSSMVIRNPPNVIFSQVPVLEIGAFEVLEAVWALRDTN